MGAARRAALTAVDLSADLTDYEERRAQDQAKLRAMVSYCQTTQCRTRFILEYFGEAVEETGNAASATSAPIRFPRAAWRQK